jgi:hypothetical protein
MKTLSKTLLVAAMAQLAQLAQLAPLPSLAPVLAASAEAVDPLPSAGTSSLDAAATFSRLTELVGEWKGAWEPGATETHVGFLIPTQCKPEEGVKTRPKGSTDAWPAPHTTECALEKACIATGYGMWVVDRFFKFDEHGHERALEYFRSTPRTSYNKVRVTGNFTDPQAVTVERLEMVD